MSAVRIIFLKEMKGFFKTPSFYLILGLVASMLSYSYTIRLSQFGELLQNYVQQAGLPTQQLNIHFVVFLQHLSNLNLVMIFIVPALTMKLLAEEKKMRTFDLLLTSPLESWQIVMGKYLAALSAVIGLMAVALAYPIATRMITAFDWLPLAIASFGIFLVGAVYAAMNLFASSLTESALSAYVISIILNIFIWFIGLGTDVVDSSWARSTFEHISLNTHLGSLVEGTIRTNGLVFFISLIALFVFLSERVVESARWR